jgi:GNAT superfamily N-acetyltransferase
MSASTATGIRLHFIDDAGEFLAAAGEHLAAEAVVSTIVTSVAHRTRAQQAAGVFRRPPHAWWLVVTDASGAVVGAGMRSAAFEPYPPYLLPMPEQAALELAGVLHARGEEVRAVNGALPACRVMAEEVARLSGGVARFGLHTRLFELAELVPPTAVPGRLLAATAGDLDLAMRWWMAFHHDADVQGGRAPGSSAHEIPDATELQRRIDAGDVWFWLDQAGQPTSLVAATPPAFGVARIGPVYTPPEQRGRGWASAAVAEVSRRIREQGARACLFTDQANPVSNRIYLALGYRPVVDMANLVIDP